MFRGLDYDIRSYGGSAEGRLQHDLSEGLTEKDPKNWGTFFAEFDKRFDFNVLHGRIISTTLLGFFGDILSVGGFGLAHAFRMGRTGKFLLPILMDELGTAAVTLYQREGSLSARRYHMEASEGLLQRTIMQVGMIGLFAFKNHRFIKFGAMTAIMMGAGIVGRKVRSSVFEEGPDPFANRTLQGLLLEYVDTIFLGAVSRARTYKFSVEDMGKRMIDDLSAPQPKHVSLPEEMLIGERFLKRVIPVFLRQGCVFGDSLDAVTLSAVQYYNGAHYQEIYAFLKWKYNLTENVYDFVWPFCVIRLEKEGLITFNVANKHLTIRNNRKAQKWLTDYRKFRHPEAVALDLVPRSHEETERKRERILPTAEETLSRRNDIRMEAEFLASHGNRIVAEEARVILRRLEKQTRFSLSRLTEMEIKISLLRERHSSKPPPTSTATPSTPKKPEPVARKNDLVPPEQLPYQIDLVREKMARLLGDVQFREGDSLAEIEETLLRWEVEDPSVQRQELGAIISRLGRMRFELEGKYRNKPNGSPSNGNGEAVCRIDWSTFPSILEFREARAILLRNGFTQTHAKGSHQKFTHASRPGAVILTVNDNKSGPIIRANSVRTALKDLIRAGVDIRW